MRRELYDENLSYHPDRSVRNEAAKIERCLEAVFNQALKPYEVIVVDGHSTDKTVKNARKFPVRILYEEYGTRAGACRVGVENAEGDCIAFTDADFAVPKDCLTSIVSIVKIQDKIHFRF